MHSSSHRFGDGHGIAERDAFEPRLEGRVLLLPRTSRPISAKHRFRFLLCV